MGRRTIKRGPGKRRIDGKDFHLADEIDYIRSRAAEHDGRLVSVGPLVLFSTDTGDAWLLDPADNAEIHLKPDELLPALAKLPASNWPYGRVVAAAENGTRRSEQDAIAIRRNKGIVGGMLEGAHIAVKWVPSV